MRPGLITIVFNPPHGPVAYRLPFEVKTDGQKSEQSHDSGIHSIRLHVAELGGGGYQTGGNDRVSMPIQQTMKVRPTYE